MYNLARLCLAWAAALIAYCVILLATLYPAIWWGVGAGVILAVTRRGPRGSTAHGSARWAQIGDLSGMIGGRGQILGTVSVEVGKADGLKGIIDPALRSDIACKRFFAAFQREPPWETVRLNGGLPHTIFCAPTGAGKGVSWILPFLMTNTDSAVVIDVKSGELARLCAEARRRMGHRVILLDMYQLVTSAPDSLNALQFVDKDSPHAIDDCREIAAEIVERRQEKGDGVHFLDNAEAGIAAVCAFLVQYGTGEIKSLQGLCDVVASPENWEKSIERMRQSDAWGGMLARMGGTLSHLKDKELASTMSTMARFLRVFSTPAVADATRSSSFDPSEILTGKMTVFITLPAERVSVLAPILKLFIGTMLRAIVKGQQKGNTNPIHFVCDEASQLGSMRQIADALTVGRSMNIRLQLYYQDLGQLKSCWPDGGDRTVLANTNQVFFSVNDNDTAKYISERLGKETVTVAGGGTNTGWNRTFSPNGGSSGNSGGANETWSFIGKDLLQPAEVMTRDPRIAICFIPGIPPLWVRMVKSYEREFQNPPGEFAAAAKALAQALLLAVLATLLAVGMTGAVEGRGQTPPARFYYPPPEDPSP